MNKPFDNHLANRQNRELKLRSQRKEILDLDAETALDTILDAPSPATLVQSFPDQDLYFLMHKIGPSDFIPILSLAASDQWEYILDVEVWDKDRLNTQVMTQAFDLLFQADPERFLRWIIMEKPDYFEFYLFQHMDIIIREHDEPPPSEFEDYTTLDDKFYFRFPEEKQDTAPDPDTDTDTYAPLSEDVKASELIDAMVRRLADMDLSVFHGLVLETMSTLPAETEEEQFRLKNIRLAEKGLLPVHEAIGIYQPTDIASLRKRPRTQVFGPETFDPELPLPPQCFTRFLSGQDLFVKSLALLPSDFVFTLESELAALVNKIISADRQKIRDKETMEKTIYKAAAYLSLGLETILQENISLEAAADLIQTYYLEDIFRMGSRAGIQLKTKAKTWYKNSYIQEQNLPLSFLGEHFLGVVGGLFLDRPLYFDNFATGELYRHFAALADIKKTGQALDQIMGLDQLLKYLEPDLASFKKGVLTYKSLILTLWAKDRLGLEKDLSPIGADTFAPFFMALFSGNTADSTGSTSEKTPVITGGTGDPRPGDLILWAAQASGLDDTADLPGPLTDLLVDMISEIQEEYGMVPPGRIDPRFIPHFLLKNQKN
ncbi:MAG TPA: DUF6178 family protein [Desulfotignum sp.]|nr:DUF6178 family protein [Desulfotignum sp.]HKK99215.1 DUF6178 family protein [Desulfotignum sp.]